MAAETSLERMLAVLDLFSEDRLEWTSEELMVKLGYSRPTLYRYLKILKDAGFLTSLPQAGFTLGPKVVALDYLVRRSDPIIQLGEPIIAQLIKKWGGIGLLLRWYGSSLVCVYSAQFDSLSSTSYLRGRPMPMYQGSVARAILAYKPKRQLLRLLAHEFNGELGKGEKEQAAFIASLKQVRREGVAIALGEVTKNALGIAAPLFDGSKVPIAALTLTLPAERDSPELRRDAASDVKSAAAILSQRLQHAAKEI